MARWFYEYEQNRTTVHDDKWIEYAKYVTDNIGDALFGQHLDKWL